MSSKQTSYVVESNMRSYQCGRFVNFLQVFHRCTSLSKRCIYAYSGKIIYLRYAGAIQSLFLSDPLYMKPVWFGGSKNKHHEDKCVKKDWTKFLDIDNYSILDSEHNWEDMWIQLWNQQTCTSSNNHYNWRKGSSIFNPVFAYVSL